MDLKVHQDKLVELRANATADKAMGLRWQRLAQNPKLPSAFRKAIQRLGAALCKSNVGLDTGIADQIERTSEAISLVGEILDAVPGIKEIVETNVTTDEEIAVEMRKLIEEYQEEIDPKILRGLEQDVETLEKENPALLASFQDVEDTASDTDNWGDTARRWAIRAGLFGALAQAASCFGAEKDQTIFGWAGDQLLDQINEQLEK